ncbi:dipeptide epimerase [Flavobacterium sp.]|uniref:dipeptide epimerase n=1 Tax=Flavobacterium sp. TaxID=239 RepID=UPI0039E299E9
MALQFAYRFFELPLAHPFTISRYTVVVQKTVVVQIGDGEFFGYGEATVNPYYHSTVERLTQSFSKVRHLIENLSPMHPTEFWPILAPHLSEDYFALCAIDMAYWDFYARSQKRTVRSYFSDADALVPLTSYTIAIDSVAVMQQKILEKPWPIYKIKLGAAHDLEIVRKLREVSDAVFRIDANCAWTAEQTIEYAQTLQDLKVEFIEQPLKADDFEGMKKVRAHSVLPIIADESCQREADVETCNGLFHGINIKLMKCGGITPALRMIDNAKSKGLLLMAGCMTESTVGISGLVQIAPLLDYLDADGAMLMASDIADGVSFDFGKIHFANGAGTGAELHAF